MVGGPPGTLSGARLGLRGADLKNKSISFPVDLPSCVLVSPVQDGKTPMETLYSWQNGAKSLLFNVGQDKADQ